jgi:CheY-like chemotaxis protein
VAHDFNTFLTVMRGHLDLLGEDAGVTPAMQESLREMTHATERATELTRQLLAFSRRQVMQTRTLRLDELVAGISRMLERVLGEDIRLERAQGAQVPWVDADPSMMEQILMNLAVNARDAMPQGGRLVLETSVVDRVPEGAPAEASAHGERWACLRVSDSGSGMDAATLERAFEPFFTTKPVGRGTGLGLATVYGIVQQHRGWVEAESAVGKGTTFRVYLPLVSAPASPPAPSAAQSASRGGMETLLVVEDEEPVRRLAEGMLRRLGYQVLVAANGPQALRLWDAHGGRIQALFTDMVMPEGMTGFALALRLRESRPDLRVLIASGYSDQIVDGDLIRSSGISYLAKPYDLPTLAAALRRVLD